MKQKFDFPRQTAGDTFLQQQFTLLINGVAVDLTSAAIKLEFRKQNSNGEVVQTLTIGNGITIVSAIGGIFTVDEFQLPEEPAIYIYDIQFTIGTTVRTYIFGQLNLEDQVTQ